MVATTTVNKYFAEMTFITTSLYFWKMNLLAGASASDKSGVPLQPTAGESSTDAGEAAKSTDDAAAAPEAADNTDAEKPADTEQTEADKADSKQGEIYNRKLSAHIYKIVISLIQAVFRGLREFVISLLL